MVQSYDELKIKCYEKTIAFYYKPSLPDSKTDFGQANYWLYFLPDVWYEIHVNLNCLFRRK